MDILRNDISCLVAMLQEFVTCVQERKKAFIVMVMMSKKENPSLSKDSRFVFLLRRITAFQMSYVDFFCCVVQMVPLSRFTR